LLFTPGRRMQTGDLVSVKATARRASRRPSLFVCLLVCLFIRLFVISGAASHRMGRRKHYVFNLFVRPFVCVSVCVCTLSDRLAADPISSLFIRFFTAFGALTLLAGHLEEHPVCKN